MTTVLAHGVFDLLHPGHIEHLRQAKAMGDRLVVSITADRWVNKGPGRPVFSAEQRAEVLRAIRYVDEVIMTDSPTAILAIKQVAPNIYVKGPDYPHQDHAGNYEAERVAVESYGGRVAFTTGQTFSSTALINGHLPRVSHDAQTFLGQIKETYDTEAILGWLEKVAGLRVILYGEHIIDRYIYTEPRGKSAKEALVTFKEQRQEDFDGGGAIIMKHLQELGCRVTPRLTKRPLVKKRWLTEPFFAKLFSTVETEWANGIPLEQLRAARRYPCAGAAAFGHGAFLTSS